MQCAILLLLALCIVGSALSFSGRALGPRRAVRTTSLTMVHDPSFLVSAVLDYSAEIESSVGTEVYAPIFKAGLTLFASGVLAAFAAAFIISKSDSFGDLADEFDRGKQTQLIASDITTTSESSAPVVAPPAASAVAETVEQKDLKGMDL